MPKYLFGINGLNVYKYTVAPRPPAGHPGGGPPRQRGRPDRRRRGRARLQAQGNGAQPVN